MNLLSVGQTHSPQTYSNNSVLKFRIIYRMTNNAFMSIHISRNLTAKCTQTQLVQIIYLCSPVWNWQLMLRLDFTFCCPWKSHFFVGLPFLSTLYSPLFYLCCFIPFPPSSPQYAWSLTVFISSGIIHLACTSVWINWVLNYWREGLFWQAYICVWVCMCVMCVALTKRQHWETTNPSGIAHSCSVWERRN